MYLMLYTCMTFNSESCIPPKKLNRIHSQKSTASSTCISAPMRSQHAYIGVSSRTQCLVKEWCHCREDSQACPKTQAQDPVVLAFSNLQRAQVHFYCTCTNRFDLYHFYILGLNTETSNRTCYKFKQSSHNWEPFSIPL